MSYNNYRIQQINAIEAIQIALWSVPGEALKLELDIEQGILVYEIIIRAYTGIYYEVKIDANTGAVLRIEREID